MLREQLTQTLKEEWERLRTEVRGQGVEGGGWEEALDDEDVLVEVSERDRDPYGIVILQGSEVVGRPLGGKG